MQLQLILTLLVRCGWFCSFAHLEPDSGNVSHGMTLPTESGNQDLVVLLNVVEATIPGDERRDLLAVFDQLHSHALADGRVRLLSFNTTATKIHNSLNKKYI